MEMCPYCGEDVPSDTAKCWKCGTELSERTDGGDDVELRGPAAERDEERKKKKKKPMRQCPYCETMVPLHSLRCNRCGKALKETLRQVAWQKGVWTAFSVVLVAVVGWLIYSYAAERLVPSVDRGRATPLSVSYPNLARIFLRAQGAGADQRESTWYREHEGRYVEWEGVVSKVIDAERGVFEATESANANRDEPEVRLELKNPEDLAERGLKQGKLIKYSARLVSYHPAEGVFVLDHALLIE